MTFDSTIEDSDIVIFVEKVGNVGSSGLFVQVIIVSKAYLEIEKLHFSSKYLQNVLHKVNNLGR